MESEEKTLTVLKALNIENLKTQRQCVSNKEKI